MSTTEDAAIETATVSAMELANYLGLSRNRVAELAARGHVVRTAHGTYRLKESVRRYLAYLRSRCEGPREASPASSARQRLDEAKARLVEIEVEQLESEYLPVEMLIQANTAFDAFIREKLVGLESRVPASAVPATRAAVVEALSELDDNNPAVIVERVVQQVRAERSR